MWLNIVRAQPLLAPVANITRLLFLLKDIIGFKKSDKPNRIVYNHLKYLAKKQKMFDDRMSFHDD